MNRPYSRVFGLIPTDNSPQDANVYCLRANGEVYAALNPVEWARLRKQGKLDSYLESRRK